MSKLQKYLENTLNFRRNDGFSCGTDSKATWKRPAYQSDQVRLVLFWSSDHRNKRSLLFDSDAVHREPPPKAYRFSRCQAPPTYKVGKASSDVKQYGEMIFGSIAMLYQGSTLKIHVMEDPHRMMVTRVFTQANSTPATGAATPGAATPGAATPGAASVGATTPINPTTSATTSPPLVAASRDNSCSDMYACGPGVDSLTLSGDHQTTFTTRRGSGAAGAGDVHSPVCYSRSVAMDVPSPISQHAMDRDLMDSGVYDSALTTDSSLVSQQVPSPSSSVTSITSLSSLHRRLHRNYQTSLEHSFKTRDEGDKEPTSLTTNKKQPKIGLALLFNLNKEQQSEDNRLFESFFFSHITLIENHVITLSKRVEKAIITNTEFIRQVMEALLAFRASINDLYTAPRFLEPVWLNMMTFSTHRVQLGQRFLKELVTATERYNSKQNGFFLSSLLTAVLTHHLAWVLTVTPTGVSPSTSYLDKHTAKWVDALAKSHPYNPLWAQLGDLYGAIGQPMYLTRTIIFGKKYQVVSQLLYVLTYFIRCSEIKENTEQVIGDLSSSPKAQEHSERTSVVTGVGDIESQHGGSEGSIQTLLSEVATPLDSKAKVEEYLAKCVQCSDCQQIASGGIEQEDERLRRLREAGKIPKFIRTTSHCRSMDNISMCQACVERWRSSGGDGAKCGDRSVDDATSHDGELISGNVRTRNEDGSELRPDDAIRTSGSNSLLMGKSKSCSWLMESGETTLSDVVEKSPPGGSREDVMDSISPPLPPNRTNMTPTSTGEGGKVVSVPIEDGNVPIESVESMVASTLTSKCDATDQETSTGVVGLAEMDIKEPEIQKDLMVGRSATATVDDACAVGNLKPASDSVTLEKRDSGVFLKSEEITQLKKDAAEGLVSSVEQNASDLCIEKDVCCGLTDVSVIQSQRQQTPTRDSPEGSDVDQQQPLVQQVSKPDGAEQSAMKHRSVSRTSTESDKTITPHEGTQPAFTTQPSIPEAQQEGAGIEGAKKRPPLLQRGNSMFDEYFDGSVSPVILPNTERNVFLNPETVTKGKDEAKVMDKRLAKLKKDLMSEEDRSVESKKPARPKTLSLKSDSNSDRLHTSSTLTKSFSSVAFTPLKNQPPFLDPGFYQSLDKVSMPSSTTAESLSPNGHQIFGYSYGRSLLAGYSDHYLSDFVLHGTSDAQYHGKMYADMRHSVQSSVLDEAIDESRMIVADTEKWTVKIHRCKSQSADRLLSDDVQPSAIICDIVETIRSFGKMKMSPEFCLMHLEDRLQEIFFKSKLLIEYTRSHPYANLTTMANVLGIDTSDLPLLAAVASTHATVHLNKPATL